MPYQKSIVSKVYDPVGFISPAIIPFKVFFQELCESKVEWDEPLPRALNLRWNKLLEGLKMEKPICIARCYTKRSFEHCTLLGFCDASQKAYAAVVYLWDGEDSCSLIASKTRIAPLLKQTVPRWELLGAVLLARLISSVK